MPTKFHLVKAMVFSVVIYGCKGWTIKEAECTRICSWKVLVLEKTLESLLDCKGIQPPNPKGSQSWIFMVMTDAEAETPILWPLIWRTDSLEKTQILGKIEERRRRGWQSMRWLDGITESMDMSLSRLCEFWWTGKPGMLQSMESERVRQDWVTELTVWSLGFSTSLLYLLWTLFSISLHRLECCLTY